jgi:ribose transport system ATP-binding protein
MAVCTRIWVMSAGRVAGSFERGRWTEEAIMTAAFSGYVQAQQEAGAYGR